MSVCVLISEGLCLWRDQDQGGSHLWVGEISLPSLRSEAEVLKGEETGMCGHSHRLLAGPWQAGAWRAPGSPGCTSEHPPDKSFPLPGTPGPTAWGPLPQRAGTGRRACSAHSLPRALAPGRDKTRLQITQAWLLGSGLVWAGCVTRGPTECTERALRNCWLNELRMEVEPGQSECTGLGCGDLGRICCVSLIRAIPDLKDQGDCTGPARER